MRLTCVAMSAVALCTLQPALGAPGDIFTTSAPAIGAEPPKETPLQDGDASVSTQTGALTYSYPISVPPGRGGMQPHLALSYSSQAPLYGGVAAGWSLSLPIITLDTSAGRLIAGTTKVYQSSLAGGRPLIPVTEPAGAGMVAYRAQGDSAYLRYERSGAGSQFWWRAYAPDGTVYYFGDLDAHTAGCTTISDQWAPLTRAVDSFGNQVDYTYEPGAAGECRIKNITWGENTTAAQVAFAQIDFIYSPAPPVCAGIPVGSQSDYRTGVKIVTGASELDSINITTKITPSHQRVITLKYDAPSASCAADHSAFRSLSSVQESAWGADSPRVDLPEVKFGYGSASSIVYGPETPISPPWQPNDVADTVSAFNLGWGYRYPDGKWPTVEAMMLDIDGDGLIDRVTNSPVLVNGHVTQCGAAWQHNNGDGTFAAKQHIALPTLKWATPPVPPYNSDPNYPYQGGPYANAPTAWIGESCALNYQQTSYINSRGGSGIPVACSAGQTCVSGVCSVDGSDCTGKTAGPTETILAYRWVDIDGDGRIDIVASPVKGGLVSYNFQRGNGATGFPNAPQEPLLFGNFPWTSSFHCPAQSFTADPAGAYTMCNGMYPYFVYRNHANGGFGQTVTVNGSQVMWPDKIQYQPVALESSTGDSSIQSSAVGQFQGQFDIDGDGYPDAVWQPDLDSSSTHWSVFRNDHTGQLAPVPGTTQAFSFGKKAGDLLLKTDWVAFDSKPLFQISGLCDVNGDGLVDHFTGAASWGTGANVELNDGTQFRLVGGNGELTTPARPATDGQPHYDTLLNNWVATGTRTDPGRMLDVDFDGRPDIVQPPSATSSPTTYFNQGGQFGSAAGLLQPSSAERHLMAATDQILFYASPSPSSTYAWEIRSDLIDLNNDGIPDDYTFQSIGLQGDPDLGNALHLMRAVPAPVAPPRLLIAIDNQRGANTKVTYASMNSAAVVQHASAGKASPHSQWVVQSITVNDNTSTTPTVSTTRYKYIDPHFSPDIDPPNSASTPGRYAMRGFDEVDITRPSGATAIERYDYSVDFSGRLKSTLVQPAGSTDIHSIDETGWQAFTLFGGPLKSYQPVVTEHFTCLDKQSEATCRASPAAYTKTTATFTALGSTTSSGPALLYAATGSLLQGGTTPNPANADGDRQTSSTFALNADTATYRLRPLASTKQVRTNGAMTMFAKSAQTWDATYRVPLTSETWIDSKDENRTIARAEYDMTTGNIRRRWKPKQNVLDTTASTFYYDAQALHVITEINEKGHEYDYVYEPGTGTRLETDGPNVRTCTTTCPPSDPMYPIKEVHKIRIDGLGRTIEHWDTTSDDGDVYTLYQTSTTSYVDLAPISISTNTKIDAGGTMWKKEKADLDGHGRPIRQTVFAQGSAPNDQVTIFEYADDGTLKTVKTPDPTANNASLVTYTYAFDSLARPTSIRRPDATAPADRSGVDIAYNGVTTTSMEFVGVAGGQPAATKTIVDPFGRLLTVQERTALSPEAWATTNYTYSADNNVRTIVDPEGVSTTLTHDFAGRRIQIDRAGGRSWVYTYDPNGNMTSELVPGWSDPLQKPDYTTYIAYDDLDRPASKIIAKRGLSDADRTLFGVGTEAYTWDTGGNHVGYLRDWQAFSPNAAAATVSLDVANNDQGQRTLTRQTLNIAGYPQLQREFRQNYFLFGGVRNTSYNDLVGVGTRVTSSAMVYDLRALPHHIDLIRSGEAGIHVAVQTRNVAGLVTKRRTDLTGAMPYIESNWTYDKLGRVSSQVVQKAPGPTMVVRQDLAYFGNDDPKSLDHYLGPNHKQFLYGYDLRHQLTSASEATTPGYFSASYQYGTAGRFTHATEATSSPPGSDVVPRDVDYLYQGVDPEQVTALRTVNNGPIIASYAYDLEGNQTSKIDSTGNLWNYVYDGKNQLRRVTKKNPAGVIQGSEEYWYDGFGQRTAIVKRDSAGLKTEMIWFIGDVEAHYDSIGAVVHSYSHLSMGTSVARVDRTSDTTTSVEFQFHGLASDTIAAIGQDGSVNAAIQYAPFGEVVEATDGGGGTGMTAHRRRFNDKYTDEISGLRYYGARYYDSTEIGWTQSDPVYHFSPDSAWVTPRRASLYEFTLNNPLRYIDPDGRSAENPMRNDWSNQARSHYKATLENINGDWVSMRESEYWAYSAGCEFTPPRNVLQGVFEEDEPSGAWQTFAAAISVDSSGHPRVEQNPFGEKVLIGYGTAVAGGAAWKFVKWVGPAVIALGTAVFAYVELANCFSAGTLVDTADGLKPIEEVRIGDLVWSEDPISHITLLMRVLNTFATSDQDTIHLELLAEDGSRDELTVTPRHPFYTESGWKEAITLNVNDRVLSKSGKHLHVVDLHPASTETVYNIEVESFHTYFVGSQHILVHNNSVTRAVMRGLDEGLKQFGQCREFASAAIDGLRSMGIHGRLLTFQVSDKSWPGIIQQLYSGTESITLNGIHQAVRVGNTVYDNLLPDGVPYKDYMAGLRSASKLSITSTPF